MVIGIVTHEVQSNTRSLLQLDFCQVSCGPGRTGGFVFNIGKFWWRTTTREGRTMPGIVEFPPLVQEAMRDFGDVFFYQPQRWNSYQHFT